MNSNEKTVYLADTVVLFFWIVPFTANPATEVVCSCVTGYHSKSNSEYYMYGRWESSVMYAGGWLVGGWKDRQDEAKVYSTFYSCLKHIMILVSKSYVNALKLSIKVEVLHTAPSWLHILWINWAPEYGQDYIIINMMSIYTIRMSDKRKLYFYSVAYSA